MEADGLLALLAAVMSTKEQSIAPKATVFGPPAPVSTYVTCPRFSQYPTNLPLPLEFYVPMKGDMADLHNRSLRVRCKKL
jgi:hypothetical protein